MVPHRPRGLIVETSPQVRPLLVPVDDRLTGGVWASTALARREATVPEKPPSFAAGRRLRANRRPILHSSPAGRIRRRRQPIVGFSH